MFPPSSNLNVPSVVLSWVLDAYITGVRCEVQGDTSAPPKGLVWLFTLKTGQNSWKSGQKWCYNLRKIAWCALIWKKWRAKMKCMFPFEVIFYSFLFRARLGKFQQKSFAPLIFCLLPHLGLRSGFPKHLITMYPFSIPTYEHGPLLHFNRYVCTTSAFR